MRKVQPLKKKLRTLKAWVTGQRKDQSPGTRMAVPAVQVDPVFEGAAGGPGSLIKFNPLTSATSLEVWDFLRVMGEASPYTWNTSPSLPTPLSPFQQLDRGCMGTHSGSGG